MYAPRGSTRVIQLGLFAVVFAALPYKLFELDRYFVPKELALHVVATFLAIALLHRGRRVRVDLIDLLLGAFLAASALSFVFATNHWLAQRALGISVSGAVIFWSARAAGEHGGHRAVLAAAAGATVCAALVTLLQVYGLTSDYFSLNRAPGGTFGNRNFVAHVAAVGLPSLVYVAITARSAATSRWSVVGVMIVAAALALTRSRAAWLAVAVASAAVAIPLLASHAHWSGVPVVARLTRLGAAAAIAAGLAIFLPNTLRWRSDSPYLESAMSMADYSSGSGRGRLAQYRNSLGMTRDDPLLGAGPGNWPVQYVRHAPADDRSLTDDGMTANPWPSSDWVAFLSERGVIATAALLGVFALLFVGSLRGWSALDADGVLARVALGGTVAAIAVVSAFDAALLLAAPALFVWSITGAASGVGRRGREVSMKGAGWSAAIALALLVIVASLARSVAQVVAIVHVGPGGTRAGWIAGAGWDPGSYRIHLRVAELHLNRGRCPAARAAALRAQALFPHARAPRRILRRCG